jgi:hypothetical protein
MIKYKLNINLKLKMKTLFFLPITYYLYKMVWNNFLKTTNYIMVVSVIFILFVHLLILGLEWCKII